MKLQSELSQTKDSQGFALILTIFIIALLSIIVVNFADETLTYQRTSRNYSERIQADYMLKSVINFALTLIELPKEAGIQEDWLGEPWALVAAAPTLPVPGFIGEPRLSITDDSAKINLNALVAASSNFTGDPFGTSSNPFSSVPTAGGAGTANPPINNFETYWKNVSRELFLAFGLQGVDHDANEFRTLGNKSYDPDDQVAIIHDWLDRDSSSHNSAAFPGEGIESGADKTWFFNRQLRSLSELALVPGITLEFLGNIAPYVRVGVATDYRVNVNTAQLPVLIALGFQESEAQEMLAQRANLPINQQILSTLTQGRLPELAQSTTVRSRSFTAIAQVRMPNVTRWAKAEIRVAGGGNSRKATITSIEFM